MARVHDVMVAFLLGNKRKVGTHETDGQTYWLHGNPIIQKDKRTFIVDCCDFPTPTTFAVLNQITAVGGRQERGHWDGYRGMTLYKDITLCGSPWNGRARKLKLAEVSISYGLPDIIDTRWWCPECDNWPLADTIEECPDCGRTREECEGME